MAASFGARVRRVLCAAAVICTLIACASADVAAHHPSLPFGDDGAGLLFIAHGYGNNPSHWPARLAARIGDVYPVSQEWVVYAHDWEAVAGRPLTAARRGARIGSSFARDLLGAGDPFPVIHLVGQSLGAHLVQGFLDEYRRGGGGATVQLTLLEPFLIRGVFGVGWGVRNFGRGADFAESYFVRNAPAVGTNRPVRRAHSFDATQLVPSRMWAGEGLDGVIGPHWWIVEYYRQSVGGGPPGFSLAPLASLEGSSDLLHTRIQELREAYPVRAVTVLRPAPDSVD